MQAVNEESLKQLSAHLESMNKRRMILPSTPQTLPFYVRSSNAAETQSKLIRVPIERTLDAKRVLKRILQSCDLPTEYIDTIKSQPEARGERVTPKTRNYTEERPPSGIFDEYEIYRDIKRTQEERTLTGWLRMNVDVARERQKNLLGLRDEIQRLRTAMKDNLKLLDLRFECGWNIEHFRGCMKSLEYMADLHRAEMKHLENRILVFAPFTGISLEGNVMLFTGDVKHNWIDVRGHDCSIDNITYLISQLNCSSSGISRNMINI